MRQQLVFSLPQQLFVIPPRSLPFHSHSLSPHHHRLKSPPSLRPSSLSSGSVSVGLPMDSSRGSPSKEIPVGLDAATEEEYASQSILLQEFSNISTIDKTWTFKSSSGCSQVMFSISQPNLLANKRRKFILSSQLSKGSNGSVDFQWAPFPIEITGASAMVPSPSGSKLLVIRNSENESPTQFEIWGSSQLEKEFHVPRSIHGSVYTDGWFEGISWSSDESFIAYVAEEPALSKPTFDVLGYKKGGPSDKDSDTWKGQGDWEEDWGETYAGKRQPALFVINVNRGDVHAVGGIGRSLSVGQVVWAPVSEGMHRYLVFVGWKSDCRKLGIKYCYNRPCALYAVKAPFNESEVKEHQTDTNATDDVTMVNLTQDISSAFFPRFSPDGKFLVFLSAKCSVDSGAHSATNSLHRIEWPTDNKLFPSLKLVDVVPAVMCPKDGCFPGLYCSNIHDKPWLSDGYTLILSSIWYSTQAILSVNVLSGTVSRITPHSSTFSWNFLALEGDNIMAVCSSPVDVPELKYGCIREASSDATWNWLDVPSPIFKCSDKVTSLLSALQFSIITIPVRSVSENVSEGAKKPIEAIFVSSNSKNHDVCNPLIVMLHGGPHTTSISSYSKSLAFLASTGYSLLIVNYRGSLGFGEEALQSLLGKIGSQDVNDVLTAIDHVIDLGLADRGKISVLGGSHGGFLTTHLIGQAPDLFVAAAARNPVCNLSLMVGTTDIPDWCFVETYGSKGLATFTEAPSDEHLSFLYSNSPISHLSKVKTPTIFLLGAQDLRVPVSNGLQYARALKEKGVDVKVIMFPNDTHGIDRPQSDFEGFLNIAVWFKKYCK